MEGSEGMGVSGQTLTKARRNCDEIFNQTNPPLKPRRETWHFRLRASGERLAYGSHFLNRISKTGMWRICSRNVASALQRSSNYNLQHYRPITAVYPAPDYSLHLGARTAPRLQ